MRPRDLKTKIFLDGGDPEETKEIKNLLGFLDGQTTNPTLISKNPEAQKRLEQGEKFDKKTIYDFYRAIVSEISDLLSGGSVSIEVYADHATKADEMFDQGRRMFSWIPNAHVKFPTTKEGLTAAERAVGEGMRVNMTLCFSQEQAAAVYVATKGAKRGDVFISPFVGRLDDQGENGMDLIKNILQMHTRGDGHVEVLTASVRNLEHFLYALWLESDIITAPGKVLREWAKRDIPMPNSGFSYDIRGLKPILYEEIGLNKKWDEFNIQHELTNKGITKFSEDWNMLIK